MKQYYVYIMSSNTRTLYIGMTNNLERRVYQHKQLTKGFTGKYGLTWLVYYAETVDVREAIIREKQMKGWKRAKKVALIEEMNPYWEDLSSGWYSNPQASGPETDSSLRSE
ncbi:MAG TPA: GIY-YIG nuclease family protein [Chloroflexia bacterium]|nr:GIY-YIG nuclease family protein [Chloroflexia bacterium]